MKTQNKFVVVTGASTGIGRAIAVEFAKEGTTVGLVARRVDELQKTKGMVEKAGGKAEILQADLSDLASINKLINSIKAKTDNVGALVNVAGIWHGKDELYAGKDLEAFDQKTILATYTVGFTAPTLLVHGLLEQLALGGGKVVNISGTFENGAKGWLPYYVSKRAIEDLTLGLSEELKEKGINVNCISPSDTATEEYIKYFPEDAKDANRPEDISKEVLSLINSNQTGQFIIIKKNLVIKNGFHR
ncbi:hypothetical protein A2210_02895 [Candidatus Woesebacteria bacterium RIFOXYA1_FULL_40_18]|uniref:Short-chain dehydrogenase n=3 Tax=Candidatus Woeseibacteriota TaxID=1752722 RepID=A0A1F8CIU3_9BACT|nr:MAG: hypothetical protein A2210_02895 [Candidatus Woesebacteria bacterium RIFOXYA1_FULL_40_18]OGM80307.1 MAG: hypothetical protein A2361_01760 [Candidatus Woesebacteria bacterium RIFOXYB1_FULL_40_26]OGM87172.1 MAG: hypothetical protein A2614_01875 [Candidatus Woesebacteria bacterium RIFOXYD1_FULL_40_21]